MLVQGVCRTHCSDSQGVIARSFVIESVTGREKPVRVLGIDLLTQMAPMQPHTSTSMTLKQCHILSQLMARLHLSENDRVHCCQIAAQNAWRTSGGWMQSRQMSRQLKHDNIADAPLVAVVREDPKKFSPLLAHILDCEKFDKLVSLFAFPHSLISLKCC